MGRPTGGSVTASLPLSFGEAGTGSVSSEGRGFPWTGFGR